MSPPGDALRWVVVLAVKRLPLAKSRLDRPDRSAVTLAMAADTAAAAAAAGLVQAVIVVTDDADARTLLSPIAAIVPDSPAAGLNPALTHGAAEAVRRWPHAGVAALAADLPALVPEVLARALGLAAEQPGGTTRAVVADAPGTGTVLLTVTPGTPLDPRFGPDSFARHVTSGAYDLTPALSSQRRTRGLRRDVDTADDLAEAMRIGAGPATTRLLANPDSFTFGWQTAAPGEQHGNPGQIARGRGRRNGG
jgi:2-phospho-L-lactate/phosphoenolpyruvate guanylyltransferase